MLGYLFRGLPNNTLERIAEALACALEEHPRFRDRCHRLSHHHRSVPAGKAYPADFTCHHIISLIVQVRHT